MQNQVLKPVSALTAFIFKDRHEQSLYNLEPKHHRRTQRQGRRQRAHSTKDPNEHLRQPRESRCPSVCQSRKTQPRVVRYACCG
jgi:hypothetical protein